MSNHYSEIKATRQNITRPTALPGHYDAFFSFPHSRHGYSGVAVFTNHDTCVPLKAEEGISGRLGAKHMKPPLTDSEKISPTYPITDDINPYPDSQGNVPSDLLELDTEGRALILDFGLFVLINLYCPNETSDARLPYKMNFHKLLSERVRRLIELEGREVIVLGDINVCSAPIDHAEGELGCVVGEDGEWEGEGEGDAEGGEGFWAHPARKWFRDWLAPKGPMHDVVRERWPDRRGMFTCTSLPWSLTGSKLNIPYTLGWNTKISARASNYGTRIDYILLTKGLLPWFKHGDIMPSIKGSDHCPVYVDLYDEIETDEGKKVLQDLLGMGNSQMDDGNQHPTRLSACHWDECSGKQKLLSSFFGKRSEKPKPHEELSRSPSVSTEDKSIHHQTLVKMNTVVLDDDTLEENPTSSTILPPSSSQTIPDNPQAMETKSIVTDVLRPPTTTTLVSSSACSQGQLQAPPSNQSASSKRKKPVADSNYTSQSNKKGKTTKSMKKGTNDSNGQAKLSSFFAGTSSTKGKRKEDSPGVQREERAPTPINVDELISDDETVQTNVPMAPASPSKQRTPNHDAPLVWSHLFTKPDPPRCIVHGEPAIELTVTKQGPNKGKMFYLCSR